MSQSVGTPWNKNLLFTWLLLSLSATLHGCNAFSFHPLSSPSGHPITSTSTCSRRRSIIICHQASSHHHHHDNDEYESSPSQRTSRHQPRRQRRHVPPMTQSSTTRTRTSSRGSGRPNRLRLQLTRPVRILQNDGTNTHAQTNANTRAHANIGKHIGGISTPTRLQISTGLTFWDNDGDQLLVSAQKPLGIILEELDDDDNNQAASQGGVKVANVDESGSAHQSGVRVGDYLVAVQNVNVENASFEEVMDRIVSAPRVVNLRFWRKSSDA